MPGLIDPISSRLAPPAERVLGRLLSAEVAIVSIVAACPGDGTSTLVRALAARAGTLGRSVRILDAGAANGEASVPHDPVALRAFLTQARANSDLLLVDCPALLGWEGETALPAAVAAAADAALLLVAAGRTPAHLIETAVEQLNAAGANLIGAVINDRDNPHLAEELQRETRRFDRLLPKPMLWLRRRIAASSLLTADV